PVTLRRGEVRTGVDLKLTAQGVISGRVTDQDGDPISNIQVQALVSQRIGSRRELTQRGTTGTDDQGNFRLQVNPGRYYLRARDSSGGQYNAPVRRGRTAQEIKEDTLY